MIERTRLLHILQGEVEKTVGCTDPAGVALAASRARRVLGYVPEQVWVALSPNVFKNAASVGVPGTGRRGAEIAAALGALLDHWEAGLALLDEVTPDVLAQAEAWVAEGRVRVECVQSSDPLTIRVKLVSGADSAAATLRGDYSFFSELEANGQVVFTAERESSARAAEYLIDTPLAECLRVVQEASLDELSFLADAARVNQEAARTGLTSKYMAVGPALAAWQQPLPEPYGLMESVRLWTAAAGEARMEGLKVPVMALAGSGNHGISSLLGVLAAYEHLVPPNDLAGSETPLRLAHALGISATVTVYIKGYIHRMTAFCGCGVAAAAGLSAAVVYLLGGSYAQMESAMQTVLGTLAGMVCDGAKLSCAFKLSAAAAQAVQAAYLACQGVSLPAATGILGRTIEETFANLGLLNNPGMVMADTVILQAVGRNLAR